jgi:hypothetical protein
MNNREKELTDGAAEKRSLDRDRSHAHKHESEDTYVDPGPPPLIAVLDRSCSGAGTMIQAYPIICDDF